MIVTLTCGFCNKTFTRDVLLHKLEQKRRNEIKNACSKRCAAMIGKTTRTTGFSVRI